MDNKHSVSTWPSVCHTLHPHSIVLSLPRKLTAILYIAAPLPFSLSLSLCQIPRELWHVHCSLHWLADIFIFIYVNILLMNLPLGPRAALPFPWAITILSWLSTSLTVLAGNSLNINTLFIYSAFILLMAYSAPGLFFLLLSFNYHFFVND